jgi:isochorismate hydrolase
MKEVYFNQAQITSQARQFLDPVSHLLRHRKIEIDKKHTALLVLDMQNYFLDPGSHAFVPSAPAIIGNINRLQECMSSLGLPVFHTYHTNTVDNAGSMKTWWRQLIKPGTADAQIIPEIAFPGAHVIEKNQYDAFCGTSLKKTLKQAGMTQLVVTGVMTHLCCETTARAAFMQGFKVYFTIDGTATTNRQFHQASILNLSHGFAIPVLTHQIVEQLGAKDES